METFEGPDRVSFGESHPFMFQFRTMYECSSRCHQSAGVLLSMAMIGHREGLSMVRLSRLYEGTFPKIFRSRKTV